jgi:hypothetical protein
MHERPLLSDFEPHVGGSFELTGNTEPPGVAVELVAAERLSSGPDSADPDASFSLLFRGPHEPKLPQMIRHLEHPEVGGIDLFLVPVREDAEARYYEAIFNYAN